MKTAILLAATTAIAAIPAAAASLSYQDFRREIESRDPSLQAQDADLRATEAARDQSRGALLPSLGVSAQYTRVSDIGDGSVTLPIPSHPVTIDLAPYIPNQWALVARVDQTLWDGRSLSQWQAARHDGKAARAGLTKAQRDLRQRSLQAWCDLWSASREVTAADSGVAALSEQRRILSLMVREGTALANDSLRAALLLRQSELAQLTARLKLEGARERAGNLLGHSLDTSVILTDSVPEMNVPERGEIAPEILQAQERVRASLWQQRAQASTFLPVLSTGAQLEDLRPNPRVVPSQDEARYDWKVWVVAQWSLFRGGSDWYGAHRAAALHEESELRLKALEESKSLEAANARRALRLSQERLTTAREVVRLSQEDRDLFQKRADAGTALRSDLLDRISQLWKAQSECAQAQAAQTQAIATLRLALGIDLP